MGNYPHSSNFENIAEATIGFAQFARNEGLNVGIQETQEALLAADFGTLDQKRILSFALKSIFCTSPEETILFDALFDQFWGRKKMAIHSRQIQKNRSNIQKKAANSAVWMGFGDEGEEEKEDSKNISGANKMERLRKTDFSKISAIDNELLEEMALRLWKQMSLRLKRKMKNSPNKGIVDLRQTIRNSIEHGGELIELKKKKRNPRKQRLVILLDVSGSMDRYSFFLLKFIWALRAHFEKVEAFIFSTKLIRITDFLDAKDLEQTLQILSLKANNWSSGTKIGDCFQTFNETFSKKVLSGKSTTIVLSDGLDTGESDLLTSEIGKIKRRTRKLIWLNPLKGMKGYQPIQKGMNAVLPEIDVFNSAHNLDSLLELENYLWHV
jgi:uncharacterized protein